MRYLVRRLPSAERDVRRTFRWIKDEMHASQGALSWLNAFDVACERLAENAHTFPVAPEDDVFEYEVRETSFRTRRGKPYRIVYTIDGDEVLILRVRGPGQDWIGPDDV